MTDMHTCTQCTLTVFIRTTYRSMQTADNCLHSVVKLRAITYTVQAHHGQFYVDVGKS